MTLNLDFEPRKLTWLLVSLLLIEIVVVFIYLATALTPAPSQLGLLFDLDAEANVPSWFSSMQLFAIGVVLWIASMGPLRKRDGLRGLLAILGGVFVFLSMDEASSIHEKVTQVMSRVSWAPRFSGGHGIWMAVYATLAVGAAIVLFRPFVQICRLYPRDVVRVVVGFLVLALGAVGVEAIGYEFVGDSPARGLKTLQVATEEFFEMAGGSLILFSVLRFALNERMPTRSQQNNPDELLRSARASEAVARSAE